MITQSLPYDIAHAPAAIQERFTTLLGNGVTPRLAEMLALHAAPRAMTDRELFAGVGTLAQQFAGNDLQLNHITAEAQKHGYKPNVNDVYQPGLARFAGDPLAFISPSGGRGQIQKHCEVNGVACHGAVNIKARELENPVEAGQLAPDIVANLVGQKIAANPDLARVPLRDLAADVIHQHGYDDSKRFGVVDEKPSELRNPTVKVSPKSSRTKKG